MSKKRKFLIFFVGLLGLAVLLEGVSFARGYFNVQRLCADTEMGCSVEGIVDALYVDIWADDELSDVSLAAIEGVLEGGSVRREAFFVAMGEVFEAENCVMHSDKGFSDLVFNLSILGDILLHHPVEFMINPRIFQLQAICYGYAREVNPGRLLMMEYLDNSYDRGLASSVKLFHWAQEGLDLPEDYVFNFNNFYYWIMGQSEEWGSYNYAGGRAILRLVIEQEKEKLIRACDNNEASSMYSVRFGTDRWETSNSSITCFPTGDMRVSISENYEENMISEIFWKYDPVWSGGASIRFSEETQDYEISIPFVQIFLRGAT